MVSFCVSGLHKVYRHLVSGLHLVWNVVQPTHLPRTPLPRPTQPHSRYSRLALKRRPQQHYQRKGRQHFFDSWVTLFVGGFFGGGEDRNWYHIHILSKTSMKQLYLWKEWLWRINESKLSLNSVTDELRCATLGLMELSEWKVDYIKKQTPLSRKWSG